MLQFIFTYLKGRKQTETDTHREKSSIHCSTLQTPAAAKARAGRSWSPGLKPSLACELKRTNSSWVTYHLLLPRVCESRKLELRVQPGLKLARSDTQGGHANHCPDCCAKCLPLSLLLNNPYVAGMLVHLHNQVRVFLTKKNIPLVAP